MRHLTTLLFFCFSSAFAQKNTLDSVFLKETKSKVHVVKFEIIKGDTVNRIISIDNQNIKYGKWVFFYDNDSLKSEGVFSFEGVVRCGTGSGPHTPHYFETRIGNWNYWTEQGKPRMDLYGEEQPSQGNYRHFDTTGRLLEEGQYADAGRIITGKRYYYSFKTGELIETIKFVNGESVGKE